MGLTKFLLILLILPFFVGIVSADYSSPNFQIRLVPHYYLSGGMISVQGMNYYGYGEIQVYNNITKFDGISFDVVGTNNANNARILNMSVTGDPSILQDSFLQNNSIQNLRILQTKTLWTSGVLNLLNYPNGEVVNFTVGVVGTNEMTGLNYYQSANYSIVINHPEPTFWETIGNKVYPGNYSLGLVILVALIILIIYLIYFFKKRRKR